MRFLIGDQYERLKGEDKNMKSFVEVFDKVQDYCMEKIERGELTDVAYRLWIKSLIPVKLDGNVACFSVPSEFQANIITKNYTGILKEALAGVLGFDVDISIITDDSDRKSVV